MADRSPSSRRLARCEKHGLHYDASVEDGCALCRGGRARPRLAPALGAAVLLLAGIGALVWRLRPPKEPSAPASPRAAGRATAGAAETPVVPSDRRREATPWNRRDVERRAEPAAARPARRTGTSNQTEATTRSDEPGDQELVALDDLPASQSCLDGDDAACVMAATALRFGRGGREKQPDLARRFLRRSCDDGHALGCLHLGYMLKTGEGGNQDLLGAERMFAREVSINEKSCEEGDKAACLRFADALSSGRGVELDRARADRILDEVAPDLKRWRRRTRREP